VAGIGWRLERLIDAGFSGAVAAYATGAAVMTLPWVLTTTVLMTLSALIGAGRADLAPAGPLVTTAFAVAMLVSGPIQIVTSRYVADRLYERRWHAIAAPLCRAIATTFMVCAVPAAAVQLLSGLPPRSALWGAALSGAVGAQWTALSVGNGLCAPTLVLGAVAAGAALSFVAAAVLATVAGLGVPGYAFGVLSGQVLTLVILLAGILRALPEDSAEDARLAPAFRDYALLALAGFAFNASLWVDKLVAWTLAGREGGALHAAASTIAWFSVIPCLAWVFVELETTFHRRFRAFFRDLEGGATLAELRRGVARLDGEARRLLHGAVTVQAAVTVFLELAADPWGRWLGLPPDAVPHYRWLLAASAALAIGLPGMILLYYFDLRRDACASALGFLLGVSILSAATSWLGLLPGVGTALGCTMGAVLTWRRVFRGVARVLENSLLGQPLGVDHGRGDTEPAPRVDLAHEHQPRRKRAHAGRARDGRAPEVHAARDGRIAQGQHVATRAEYAGLARHDPSAGHVVERDIDG